MQSLNKAGLLGSALIALLIITSCSDSGTSTTGITPLSRDAAETGAINNANLKKEADHGHGHESVGVANPGQGEGLGHQHADPGNVVTTTTVLALAAIPASRCGNLIQEAGEKCDDGPSGSATCTANCTLKEGRGGEIVAERFCGDGVRVVSLGEQCDDGNNNNNDSCTNSCKKAACGDGYTQPSNGEQCDDGNKVDTDSCNNDCQKPNNVPTTITTVTETTEPDGGTTTTTVTETTDSDGGATRTTTNTISGGGTTATTPALCRDKVTRIADGCTCTNYNETDGNRSYTSNSGSVPRYTPGYTLTFFCVEGYVLDGSQTMTCSNIGDWSNQPPSCVKQDSPAVVHPEAEAEESAVEDSCTVEAHVLACRSAVELMVSECYDAAQEAAVVYCHEKGGRARLMCKKKEKKGIKKCWERRDAAYDACPTSSCESQVKAPN